MTFFQDRYLARMQSGTLPSFVQVFAENRPQIGIELGHVLQEYPVERPPGDLEALTPYGVLEITDAVFGDNAYLSQSWVRQITLDNKGPAGPGRTAYDLLIDPRITDKLGDDAGLTAGDATFLTIDFDANVTSQSSTIIEFDVPDTTDEQELWLSCVDKIESVIAPRVYRLDVAVIQSILNNPNRLLQVTQAFVDANVIDTRD